MERTPEKIKRGMEIYLTNDEESCERFCFAEWCDCPYRSLPQQTGQSCGEIILADTLAYIQQLEQDNAQKNERIRELERERDQALHDMCNIYGSICLVCKNFYRPDKTVLKFACKEFGELRNHGNTVFCGKFEWRGVEEENHGENR